MDVRFPKIRVGRYSKNAEKKDQENNSCVTVRWVRNSRRISGKKLKR